MFSEIVWMYIEDPVTKGNIYPLVFQSSNVYFDYL